MARVSRSLYGASGTLAISPAYTLVYGMDEMVSLTASVMDYVKSVDQYDSEHPGEISPDMLNCVHAVANYGHYVQPFLAQHAQSPWRLGEDYKEMTKYYDDMNDVSAAADEVKRWKPTFVGSGASSLDASSSLSLDSLTTFSLFLAPKDGTSAITVNSAEFDGEYCEAELQKDGRYRIRIEGIKAYQLSGDLVVRGTIGGEPFTIYISPMQYARAILNGGYDDIYKDAMASLYYYYYWSNTVY